MNRVIEYTKSLAEPFQRYVDIGWSELTYDFDLLNIYDREQSYLDWYNELKKCSLGYQISVLNFLLSEFDGSKSEYDFVTKLNSRISDNFDLLKRFNNKWFDEDAPLFKGLDFGYYDKADEIIESTENEDGIRLQVKFEDGSLMKFLDDNDQICSYYILESEFEDFEREVESFIKLFG
ncbi:hypothetical protein [Flavobacterium sp. M31R6]|uniref:hypothetical protein n=1 Tax=Flavobacterium sp. M31R6 TaxID=2739062 RepID=UPI001567CB16|nr:hypothetical protein [Flavobacterium sp. M31R6]QKJ64972.1 hypothetical protein HQN62_18150 [Flavobacterium sp. M31R6]